MKKRIIILALSTACACLGEAQENNIENRTVDLGTQTTTEFRKTQAVEKRNHYICAHICQYVN